MNIRQFISDDDAVSPVIGVILMVAITVILAAVIGAFVLGFGGGGPSAPSVTWDTSVEDGGSNEIVVFAHGGGDTISDASVLSASSPSGNDLGLWSGGTLGASSTLEDEELTTGDAVGVDTGTGTGASTTTNTGEYVLLWSSPDSDSTQELSTHDYN